MLVTYISTFQISACLCVVMVGGGGVRGQFWRSAEFLRSGRTRVPLLVSGSMLNVCALCAMKNWAPVSYRYPHNACQWITLRLNAQSTMKVISERNTPPQKVSFSVQYRQGCNLAALLTWVWLPGCVEGFYSHSWLCRLSYSGHTCSPHVQLHAFNTQLHVQNPQPW